MSEPGFIRFQAPPALPEPLRGTERPSFAYQTISQRLPDIARRTMSENDFPPDITARMRVLVESMPDARIIPIQDPYAPDAADWASYTAPYLDLSWLEAPWFFAETYFFRRILEATGFFRQGPGQGLDPYAHQKRQGMQEGLEQVRDLSEQLSRMIAGEDEPEHALVGLMAASVGGNQADLSIWPADTDARPQAISTGDGRADEDGKEAQSNLLVDDRQAVAQTLLAHPANRVDFILDNSGLELTADLALADYLLSTERVAEIHFHLKPYPTYVSDATISDAITTLETLSDTGWGAAQAFASRIHQHILAGRLLLEQHLFWTSPLPLWQMPNPLRQEFERSALMILKGDVNYRRALGDRHWEPTVPFQEIVRYRPAPILALRVFKSEIGVGLRQGESTRMRRRDPNWMTAGQWGLIQFAP